MPNPEVALPHAPTNVLRGMALVGGAVLVFASMDATTKHLAASYNVPLIVALHYIGNLALLVILFAPRKGRALFRTRRTGLVLVRAMSLALASLFAGLALQRMPVAEITAIIFLAPFGVTILGGALLAEKIALPSWAAAGFGFLGVLLIVRPGSELDPLGVTFAMLTAATVSYNLLSRVLARTETTPALIFYSALAGTLVFGATLPWSLHGPKPGTAGPGPVRGNWRASAGWAFPVHRRLSPRPRLDLGPSQLPASGVGWPAWLAGFQPSARRLEPAWHGFGRRFRCAGGALCTSFNQTEPGFVPSRPGPPDRRHQSDSD